MEFDEWTGQTASGKDIATSSIADLTAPISDSIACRVGYLLFRFILAGVVIGVLASGAWAQERSKQMELHVPHLGVPGHNVPAWMSVSKPRFVKHTDVVFRSEKEFELKCDVFVPDGDGPFPTVLALHGGAWRFGTKWQVIRPARRLAQAGFVVVAIDYRLAPRWKFPAQIYDSFAALAWIRDHADEYSIDTENVFGFGYSAGAQLISLLAVTSIADWPDLDFALNDKQIPRFKAVAARRHARRL